jgi:phage terminase large subunit-like protein
LLAREGQDVIVTRGSTFDNAANLAPAFLEAIRTRYDGTRLGRQELFAELLLDVPGALWTRDMLDRAKSSSGLPDMKRVVVAVDPSGTRGAGDGGDSVGIVVAGLGADELGYVLADRTCKLSPDGWGREAVKAYHEFEADRMIAERNFGGAMVEHVIRTIDRNVSYREVTASRGKIVRAEPIAALYEQSRVRHAGSFVELDDQLAAMTSEGYVGVGSPDRADALVWALTDLLVDSAPGWNWVEYYRRLSEQSAYAPPERSIHMRGPEIATFTTYYLRSGKQLIKKADGTAMIPTEDVPTFRSLGWQEIGPATT